MCIRDRAQTDLEAASPELASLVSVDPISASQTQALLADSTAMLIYHSGEGGMRVWLVKQDLIESVQLACDETVLHSTLARFREQINLRLEIQTEAQQLWQWLVAPVVELLQSVKHIVIVPHGVLHYCPFGALMDGEGRFFIQTHSLSLAPSATVLKFCQDKGVPVTNWADSATVMAFANPLTSELDLPFADKEVAALERSFPGTQALFGVSVTEETVREQSQNPTLLHFACHGVYESDSPLFSALLLTPQGVDDGRLEAREIFHLKLHCQLATLSACETGLSEVTQGDEIIGLARSFLFAGAPAIVTSLWKVDDLATAVMMKRFYRNLSAGLSRAEALRQAQQAVMVNVGQHPAYWAAFSVTGDYR
jgi:CHAT domain-containing protein